MPKDISGIKWNPTAKVYKYTQDQADEVKRVTGIEAPDGATMRKYFQPVEVRIFKGNLLTLVGATRIASLVTGSGGQALTNTSCRLGVGDWNAAATINDTGLGSGGASGANQYYRIMDATFPSISSGQMTFKSTFGTGDANFPWNCWGIDVDSTTPVSSGGGASSVNDILLNRKVANLGTKTTGIWVLEVIVEFV